MILMEDEYKDITRLLSNFDPELPSDYEFMHKLQQRLDVAEMVRAEQSAMTRRNRMAICIAALSGFVMGTVLTLLYPLLWEWLPSTGTTTVIAGLSADTCYRYALWGITALLSVVTAYNSYELTVSPRKKPHL